MINPAPPGQECHRRRDVLGRPGPASG